MTNILHEAEAISADTVSARRYLHSHPGAGFDIPETIAFTASELEKAGIDAKKCGRAGITALIGERDRVRTVL